MRKIDATDFEALPKPADCGPASQLMWLPIADLVIDDSYQRPVNGNGKKTITAIVSGFDWRKFAPVIVSPLAGGVYAIVDGQHRTTAAAAWGHDTVPCAVIQADRRTQAEAFGAINGVVTQVSRHQQFKAALAAGDPAALRMASVTARAGVRILFHNTQATLMKPGETIALTAIRRGIDRYGDDVTIAALKAIVASAGELGGYLRAPIIMAVLDVLHDHRDWMAHSDLKAAFELIDLEDAWRRAAGEAASRKGLTTVDLLQATIIRHCDKHLETAPGSRIACPMIERGAI